RAPLRRDGAAVLVARPAGRADRLRPRGRRHVALTAAAPAPPASGGTRALSAGLFLAIFLTALVVRLAAGPGTDVPPFLRDFMGRATRLDAYWYTRSAVEATRGDTRTRMPAKFDRPVYTALCRAVFAVGGVSPRGLALP